MTIIYDDSVDCLLSLLLFLLFLTLSRPVTLLFRIDFIGFSNTELLFFCYPSCLVADHFSSNLMLEFVQWETLHSVLFHREACLHESARLSLHPFSCYLVANYTKFKIASQIQIYSALVVCFVADHFSCLQTHSISSNCIGTCIPSTTPKPQNFYHENFATFLVVAGICKSFLEFNSRLCSNCANYETLLYCISFIFLALPQSRS